MIGFALSRAIQHLLTLIAVYKSFKALQTPETSDDSRLLTFWIVFGLFSVIENIASIVIAWLPLYYELKIAFTAYLMLRNFKGSLKMYTEYVHPWLCLNEDQFDAWIDSSNGFIKKKFSIMMRNNINRIINIIAKFKGASKNVVEAAAKGAVEADKAPIREQEQEEKDE
ncbi:hypothetical protein PCE1_000336 [Barthelona sp. PCE]